MTGPETPAVRLSIWRPLKLQHCVIDAAQGHFVDTSSYQESIFRWDMQSSPRDALSDPAMSQRVEQQFFAAFLAERQPEMRTIERLREALIVLDEAIGSSSAAWMPSDQTCPVQESSGGESSPCLRQNPLLALRIMLLWVCDTFRDVPGACVTLR